MKHLNALQIARLWNMIRGCPMPRGMDPGFTLGVMQRENEYRLAFEVGALMEPDRHLTIVSTLISEVILRPEPRSEGPGPTPGGEASPSGEESPSAA